MEIRFSTIMKSTRKITPMARGTTNAIGFVAIDPLNVIAIRKLMSVTVIVIIPIKSIRCFLACFSALVGISLGVSKTSTRGLDRFYF